MKEEIFGPILPVISVPSVRAAVAFIKRQPKPLALYCFSTSKDAQDEVLAGTSAGGTTINHVWLHVGVPALPFGGVGESGMGAYHGRHSFETFSHKRGVLKKPTLKDPPLMLPPYTARKRRWLKRLV
jgi:aldehyde dehydrogenase (NAD+)